MFDSIKVYLSCGVALTICADVPSKTASFSTVCLNKSECVDVYGTSALRTGTPDLYRTAFLFIFFMRGVLVKPGLVITFLGERRHKND